MRLVAKVPGIVFLVSGMLASAASGATPHSEFVGYPGWAPSPGRVEMYDDKGLVVEMVVNCGQGRFGIITLSKAERLFCGPDHRCVGNLDAAINKLCR